MPTSLLPSCSPSQEVCHLPLEDDGLDEEIEEAWAQLQRALATRRELQHKLISAKKTTDLWDANRDAVRKLAAAYDGNGMPLLQQCFRGMSRIFMLAAPFEQEYSP